MANIQRGFQAYDGSRAPKPPFVLNKDSWQAKNLIGFWPFLPGPEVKDLSGHNNHLQLNNLTTADFTHRLGKSALKFTSGSDQYLNFPGAATPKVLQNLLSNLAGFTVFCMTYPYSSGQGGLGTIMDNYVSTTGGWALLHRDGVGGDTATYQVSGEFGTADSLQVTSDNTVSYNALNLMGFSFDELASKASVYYNGNKASLQTDVAGDRGSPDDSTHQMRVGNRTSDVTRDFDGEIFHIAIWDRKFSDAEMWELYNPSTRWDLYYELGRRSIFTVPAQYTQTSFRFRNDDGDLTAP